MVKQKLTQLELIIIACFSGIIACFSGIALSSYLSVFVAQIISEFYGYDYMSQTSALLFLIVASLNVLIVVQMVKLFIFHKSTQNLSGFGFPSENSINRNLQVTPSASPKEATLPSVNSDIKLNFGYAKTKKSETYENGNKKNK